MASPVKKEWGLGSEGHSLCALSCMEGGREEAGTSY